MNRRTGSYALACVLTAIVTLQSVYGANAQSGSGVEKKYRLFGEIFLRIQSDFVDSPDGEKLLDAAIKGMLESLDANSTYINPEAFHEMLFQNQGKYGGIGVDAVMEGGLIKVVAAVDETPAARAGLMPNDLIARIDGDEVQAMSKFEAADRMRGATGTPVTLSILRKGHNPFDVTLLRDEIRTQSIKWQILDLDIGYVRISTFTEGTQEELEEAVFSLKKKAGGKLKGYIIDLRNNPGGLLTQAVSVSDSFLDFGEVLSIRGRRAEHSRSFSARTGDLADGMPVVVLINGGSASGAEVVAGALQDQKRATVVGTKSFGKGTVQSIIKLGEQGGLKLTTARYYTPSGRSIESKGIDPDIVVVQEGKPSSLDYSLQSNQSITDVQLKAAIDILHGKVVSPAKSE
ncbi:S41 family peptidase [Mesorhizobium onobrychidis]|uniref:S41 family peptidase n=1 Tax=Mesorhizobium onobrychidis TaxID=2775404 RepID=A0ABY5R5H2_9HYPH|nr:S41 family peptidase [Mesorhizobium onobrychidis]UVC17912.1 S41 family peptidase [Mesorhizobium onobrychidis]